MSFAGSSAPSVGQTGGVTNNDGNPTFTKNDIRGQTRTFAGRITPQEFARRALFRKELEQQQRLAFTDLKKANKIEDLDISEKEYDDMIEQIVELLPELSNEQNETIQDYFKRIQYVNLIKQYQDLLDEDFYYSSLEEYGIAPGDDVLQADFNVAQIQKQLTDDLLAEMNEIFDGLGKAGIQGVEELGESLTDFARAIADKNPEFAVEAVLEVLGVEFDENGDFDLRGTIVDNVRPIFQKMMARYVINPAKEFIRNLGFTQEETAELETQLLEEVEASTATIESELTALAETEVNPLMGIVIGGSQALSALSRAVAGVIQAFNMTHDAYTQGNHTWFTDSNKFEWVRKIPLVGEVADGIASLVEEAKDARDYRKGQTDRQRYERALSDYNDQRRNYAILMNAIINGQVDIDDVAQGKKVTINLEETVFGTGGQTITIPIEIDTSKLKASRIDDTIETQQFRTANDALEELDNLQEFYEGEKEKFDNDEAFQRLIRGQFSTGGRTGFDDRVAAQLGLSPGEALALVQNYDNIRFTLMDIEDQQEQYRSLRIEASKYLVEKIADRLGI